MPATAGCVGPAPAPVRAIAEAISSRSAGVSSRVVAGIQPSICAGERAPTIAAVTPGQASVQATATADTVVPPGFSQGLAAQLQQAGKNVTLHVYPGADHNLSPDTAAAVHEALAFFDQYLK